MEKCADSNIIIIMIINIWNNLINSQWLEHHFLYFGMSFGLIILILLVLIIIRLSKHIKRMNLSSKDRAVKYMRKTSKYNKESRKRLKF